MSLRGIEKLCNEFSACFLQELTTSIIGRHADIKFQAYNVSSYLESRECRSRRGFLSEHFIRSNLFRVMSSTFKLGTEHNACTRNGDYTEVLQGLISYPN